MCVEHVSEAIIKRFVWRSRRLAPKDDNIFCVNERAIIFMHIIFLFTIENEWGIKVISLEKRRIDSKYFFSHSDNVLHKVFRKITNLRNILFFTLCFNFRLEVPMMSGRFELPHGYSTDLECQVLEIPFSQRRVSMFILLPDNPKTDGILKLETNLTSDNVKLLFSTLKVCIIIKTYI